MYNFIHTYDDMPKWTDSAEGAEMVDIDVNNLCVTTLPPVQYAVKDNYSLNIRFIFPEGHDLNRKYPLIIHVKGSGWEEQWLEMAIGIFEP